jgi:hypothetical protein
VKKKRRRKVKRIRKIKAKKEGHSKKKVMEEEFCSIPKLKSQYLVKKEARIRVINKLLIRKIQIILAHHHSKIKVKLLSYKLHKSIQMANQIQIRIHSRKRKKGIKMLP